jgi:glycosyltransferase involved in cell wall biosynthesis
MMRIAYICTDPGVPVFGCKGSSVHVQEVIRALLRTGACVTLFARRFGGEAPFGLEAVECIPLPRPTTADIAAREQELAGMNDILPSLLDAQPAFDLVYERHALWSHAAMGWARVRGVPAVLEVNAPLVEEQAKHRALHDRARAEAQAEKAFDAADHIIAVSSGMADRLKAGGASASKIHVIANGVDTARFNPQPRGAQGPMIIGFVGTLKPWHGLSILVEAARLARDACADIRLLIVGDGPEREALDAELTAAGLADVTELTGAVESPEIPSLIARMDVAVAPYPDLRDFYFSPLKIMEYMAAGCAVIASRIGDVDGLISHEVDGLLCPPGDARALADAINRLQRDPDLRASLGYAARDKAVRDLGWDAVVERILGLAMESVPC